MPNQIKCGPSGGIGGSDFEDIPPANARIKSLTVWYREWVDAIQVFWSDGTSSQKHGGGSGDGTTIPLADGEYLVGISGKYGAKVDSIRFVTNQGTHGPYGGDGGDVKYHYNDAKHEDVKPTSPSVTIVGFWGRAGDHIDAIGCVFSV